jgi:hypothetical protein
MTRENERETDRPSAVKGGKKSKDRNRNSAKYLIFMVNEKLVTW